MDDHPVTKLVREMAEAKGMNWSATPPSEPGGEWDYKIWLKGRPAPSNEETPGAVVYVGEQVTPDTNPDTL